jgi:uncharacterized cupredoxin-like copper-binding protein
VSLRRTALPVVVAVLVAATGYGIEAVQAGGDPPAPLGPGDVTIRLGVEHSLFEVDEIRVVEGTRVRFVVDNTDPIAHELIVGDASVHARHEAGTHAAHPPVPGEVSVEANARAVTTYRFDEPGTVEFACHLPRHYDFGMHGRVVVVASEGR